MFGHLRRKAWRAAVPLAALAGVLSCQNTTVVEEEAPPASGDHYVRFRVPDSSTIPDSLWYRGPQDSGSKSFTVQASDLTIRFFAPLHAMEGRDTLQIHTYRMGLHLGATYAGLFQYMEFAGVRTVRTPADSLAIVLLRKHDSLRKANPADFKDTSAAGKREAFQKAVAQLVFQGHPAVAAYKRMAPVGLDTAKVNRQILTMAANSGLTLGEVVRRWNLGLDYGGATSALKALGMDSASLNPFRVETNLSLDTLHLGEAPVGLVGKIRGKKGIASVKFTIESDSVDKTDRFVLADLPDPKDHPELLDFAGHPTFQPRSGTAVGKYTLRVKVSDSLANTQIFSASFVVAGALDHVGPSLGVVSPTSSVVRDFNDSQLVVRVEARDGSGIQWVKIGGVDAHKQTDGIWFDTLVVPVSATSVSVSIQARDGAGNTSDTAIQVRRNEAPKPTAPRLTLVGPANGTLVPFDSTGVWVEWKAQTDFGKIEGVTVDGKDAKQEGDVWRLRVSLSPDGKLVNLPVRAVSSVGLSVTEFVSVGRKSDTVGPVVQWKTPTQGHRVAYDVKALEVKVAVADPSGVDSVRIGGKKPDTSGGQWFATLDLAEPGEITRIHVKAWDHLGNATDSVLLVSRDPIPGQLPPSLSWKSPDKSTGTVIPFSQAKFLVQVVLTDISGIDGSSVKINGSPATAVNDSVWELSVDLPPSGQPQTITLEAKNKRGVSTSGFVSVARAKDEEKPTASRVAGTQDRSVEFDTSSVEVGWTAKDNDRIAQAWIQDSLVVSDATGYRRRVKLELGTQWIRFRAVDPAGNEVRDSVSVERRMDTVKAVTISDINGKLRSGSFWVKLTCATPGATIRYTLDGSEPKATSPIFGDSLKIDTTITLKARGFAQGRVDGPVAVQGYQLAVPVSISGSETHYLVVMSDGSLWGFGSNNCNAIYPDQGCVYQQYPDGSSNGKLKEAAWDVVPHRLDSAVRISAAGAYQSFWIRSDNTLWAVGSNGGSMGIATAIDLVSPELIFRDASEVELVPNSSDVGGTGAVAMQSNGKIWATGNSTGAGKLTKNSPSWTKVADSGIEIRASSGLLLVLKRDRSLWGIGSLDGQLVNPNAWTKIADSVVTIPGALSESILFQKLDGSVWQAGYSLPGSGLDPLPLTMVPALAGIKIEQIATLGYFYLLRTSTGDVVVYGMDVPIPRIIASGVRDMAVGGQGLATISTRGELRVQALDTNGILSTAMDRNFRIKF